MPLKKIKVAGNAYDAWATKPDVEEAKKKIMGADSQLTFDCGSSIPACWFDNGDFYDIVLDENKYWLDSTSECTFPEIASPDDMVGMVLCATEVDEENGYLLCTSYTAPIILGANTVNKSGDDYYLNVSSGATFVPVVAGKNYRCSRVVSISHGTILPLQPQQMVTGYLYIWEEYEGENIHDGVEKINAHTTAEVTDRINTIDADYAEQLHDIIGDPEESDSESESIEGTSQTEQEIGELRTLRESYDQLVTQQAAMVSSWSAMVTKRNNLDAMTFTTEVDGIVDFLDTFLGTGAGVIKEINDDVCTKIPYSIIKGNTQTNLEKIRMSAVTQSGPTQGGFSTGKNPALKIIDFPNLGYIPTYQLFQAAYVEEIHLPKCYYIYTYQQFQGATNLILLEIGESMTTSFNIATWDPTTALLSNSTSLVKEGEPFASNLEKLLYNIRTYIATKLPTDCGSCTITLSANIKAAIQADTETLNSFPSNWTIA